MKKQSKIWWWLPIVVVTILIFDWFNTSADDTPCLVNFGEFAEQAEEFADETNEIDLLSLAAFTDTWLTEWDCNGFEEIYIMYCPGFTRQFWLHPDYVYRIKSIYYPYCDNCGVYGWRWCNSSGLGLISYANYIHTQMYIPCEERWIREMCYGETYPFVTFEVEEIVWIP